MASHSLSRARLSDAPGLRSPTAQQAEMSGALASTAPPDLSRSAEISHLFQGIQVQGVEEMIQPHFEGLTMAQKAVMVVEMLSGRAQQAEVIGSLVDHLWNIYVVPQKLWEYYDGGEDKFMEDVDFTRFVQPTLDSAASTRSRKERELSTIGPAWGAGWEKVIESNSCHWSILSEKYLYHMAYLARNRIGLLDATVLLRSVRDKRLANPQRGVPTSAIVTVGDARKVTDAVKRLSKLRNISPSQCTMEDFLSSLQVAAPETVISRITELESPAAAQVSHQPTGLFPADTHIGGITLQVLPQICSLKESEKDS